MGRILRRDIEHLTDHGAPDDPMLGKGKPFHLARLGDDVRNQEWALRQGRARDHGQQQETEQDATTA